MIDSCDPDVACWSEDGTTFVVKDPIRFERTIIPQFFKHSKFTSFVRVSAAQQQDVEMGIRCYRDSSIVRGNVPSQSCFLIPLMAASTELLISYLTLIFLSSYSN